MCFPPRVAAEVADFTSDIAGPRPRSHWLAHVMLYGFLGCGAIAIVASGYEAMVAHQWPIGLKWEKGVYQVADTNLTIGVEKGDTIVAFNETPAETIPPANLESYLRRPPRLGAHTVAVRRDGQDILLPIPLQKGRVATPVTVTLLTLVAALGLVTLRSRAEQVRGRREFVMLCLATSAVVLFFVPTSSDHVASRLSTSVTGTPELGWPDLYVWVVWPLLFALFLGRFIVAVAGEPVAEQRWLFGWRVAAMFALAAAIALAASYGAFESVGFSLFVAALLTLFFASLVLRRYSLLTAALLVLVPIGLLTVVFYGSFAVEEVSFLDNSLILAQLAAFTCLFLIAVVTLILWPLTIMRLSRSGQRAGGTAARQIDVAMMGVRIGALCFIAFAVVLFGGGGLLMREFFGRAPEMQASWSLTIYGTAIIVLFLTAAALPFVGVFLAVTRNGLWNADLVFRRVIVLSSVGALFFVVWEVITLVINAIAEGPVTPVFAPVVAALVLALTRRHITRAIDRLVFPRSRDLTVDIQRMRLAAASGAPVLTPDHVASLRASGAAVVTVTSSVHALARKVGNCRPVARAVARITSTDSRVRQFIVFEDDEVWFGFRVPLAEETQGIVLLDPVRGSRLYDESERRELEFLFELIKDRLFTTTDEAFA
jgi:hypothetical protein